MSLIETIYKLAPEVWEQKLAEDEEKTGILKESASFLSTNVFGVENTIPPDDWSMNSAGYPEYSLPHNLGRIIATASTKLLYSPNKDMSVPVPVYSIESLVLAIIKKNPDFMDFLLEGVSSGPQD